MNNKLALISGACGGIGTGIANHLAALGYSLGLGYSRNADKATAFARHINDRGGRALAVHLDYLDRQSIIAARTQLIDYFSTHVSVLINNGAKAQEKPFREISDEDWRTMLEINLQGPFKACQVFLPDMLTEQEGNIINISSIGGQWGGINQVHYAAAKAGLINLTRSLAKLYAKNGICATAVAIGLVKTAMTESELNTVAGKAKAAAIPAGRVGTIEDVANTVAFLCKKEAAYLSGQTLNVNGGMYFS